MMRNLYLLLILIFLGLVLLPGGFVLWALVTPFDKKGVIIFQYSRLWAFCLIHMNPFWRVNITGIENVDINQNYVMMANHQGMYDIPLLYYIPLHFKWVAKREILRVPIIGWVLWMQHGVAIKRGDKNSAKNMLKEGIQFLEQGNSVMIFPEGTRSQTGCVNGFLSGAFLMAAKAHKPILPIVIDGAKDVTEKKGHGHIFQIKILPPVSAERIGSSKLKELSTEIETMIRQAHQQIAPHHYTENQEGDSNN